MLPVRKGELQARSAANDGVDVPVWLDAQELDGQSASVTQAARAVAKGCAERQISPWPIPAPGWWPWA